jgi:acyl carrier protein
MNQKISLSKDELLFKINTVFRNELDDESTKLSESDTNDTVSGWDSLAHVRIITSLESEFGFQFDVSEIEEAVSIKFIIEAINKHLVAA